MEEFADSKLRWANAQANRSHALTWLLQANRPHALTQLLQDNMSYALTQLLQTNRPHALTQLILANRSHTMTFTGYNIIQPGPMPWPSYYRQTCPMPLTCYFCKIIEGHKCRQYLNELIKYYLNQIQTLTWLVS